MFHLENINFFKETNAINRKVLGDILVINISIAFSLTSYLSNTGFTKIYLIKLCNVKFYTNI